MTYQQEAFQTTASEIIKNLNKRGMEGYFYENSQSCIDAISKELPAGSSISWGGSETLKESGMMDILTNGNFHLIDRFDAKTPEESRELYAKSVLCDYYFMSTNAITLDGELINIDGHSNRVACLTHGPSHVLLLVGMNKLVPSIESAVDRIQNIAAVANAKRLNRKTPCAVTGRCGNCFSPDCMCNQIVFTRRSGHPGRIKVYLIAENLGY